MNGTKNLCIGFSPFGTLIAGLQLLPNIIWALFPPAINTLEGNASSNLFIEYGEHVLGVSIVILLVFLVNKTQKKFTVKSVPVCVCFTAIGFYWLCWILYFCAVQPLPLIFAMVVLPPIAFFCAGIAKKVYLISVVSTVFLIFHITVATENFIM
ncbi:MAG: hypothetical protein FWE74_10485 [Oscillospiraceae bacterium]|nr:hypothetical protein [Oscillospiraceae bacterium]